MQVSKIIAGALSIGLIAGAAYALDKSSEKGMVNAREAICGSTSLGVIDQSECKTQMQAASTETEKQQIATRYRSKADMRAFRESIGVSNSGGVSGTTATPRSLNAPNATTQPAAPSAPAVKK